mmetsp:Transcript_17574/g.33360  ORF Transcript_17574/g.33360 Transcript_17574/m.33360 type:complete len:328 (-) Transcript_17574:314-1297(-)|eukprot:CAMPEP_0170196320 /NCGR_PEP_ID=MMETSP0040_2-20121228/63621_1 /TAXON_ID=641309 /ORGANISM="Lotharella oceanica, Strain CCMP622" /LENGTH=327 /DNA_ID=CAMNT_0010445701 /DNA_START=59 /DNA_END=1042 /DNA_ORIENTATION=-
MTSPEWLVSDGIKLVLSALICIYLGLCLWSPVRTARKRRRVHRTAFLGVIALMLAFSQFHGALWDSWRAYVCLSVLWVSFLATAAALTSLGFFKVRHKTTRLSSHVPEFYALAFKAVVLVFWIANIVGCVALVLTNDIRVGSIRMWSVTVFSLSLTLLTVRSSIGIRQTIAVSLQAHEMSQAHCQHMIGPQVQSSPEIKEQFVAASSKSLPATPAPVVSSKVIEDIHKKRVVSRDFCVYIALWISGGTLVFASSLYWGILAVLSHASYSERHQDENNNYWVGYDIVYYIILIAYAMIGYNNRVPISLPWAATRATTSERKHSNHFSV